MSDPIKFKGKYRIPSARWAAWDYGSNAAYFVTICTADRACDFGTITDGKIILTPLGQSALDCWHAIPAHFPFVELGEFVVMPNHVHGIVIINKPVDGGTADGATVGGGGAGGGAGGGFVQTQNFASLPIDPASLPIDPASLQNTPPQNKFGPQSKNLASIIRGYKTGVTKFARQNNLPFTWQPRYHDHVIRDSGEYERIQHYISANVQNWAKDKFYYQLLDK